jgi:hypothetical protein
MKIDLGGGVMQDVLCPVSEAIHPLLVSHQILASGKLSNLLQQSGLHALGYSNLHSY